jgi:ribosomal protein S4
MQGHDRHVQALQPDRVELPAEINEQLIVELYSK